MISKKRVERGRGKQRLSGKRAWLGYTGTMKRTSRHKQALAAPVRDKLVPALSLNVCGIIVK